jgi:hypothetical protein
MRVTSLIILVLTLFSILFVSLQRAPSAPIIDLGSLALGLPILIVLMATVAVLSLFRLLDWYVDRAGRY